MQRHHATIARDNLAAANSEIHICQRIPKRLNFAVVIVDDAAAHLNACNVNCPTVDKSLIDSEHAITIELS